MRWIASFVALGLMMALFHRFTGGGPVEARATVAFGLLLVAAAVGGDLARHLRLPRISGYLIVGFAAGPAWLGLVRADEIRALGFVIDTGVAALALAIGAALPIERLRAHRATLTRLSLGAMLIPFAAVAAVLAWSLRRFPRESLLLLLSTALVAALVARQLHLEVLVIALAAGFTLRNGFVTEGGQLQVGIDAAVPIAAVIVFTQAGAAVDLGTVSALWPWIMLLAAVRIASLRYGLRWAAGGRVPAVTPVMASAGWLMLIPQAGVALGVAALARRAFPEWGVSLEGFVVAMIGVHLVVGPLCFRLGLRLAGEISEEGHVAEQIGAPGPAIPADRSRL